MILIFLSVWQWCFLQIANWEWNVTYRVISKFITEVWTSYPILPALSLESSSQRFAICHEHETSASLSQESRICMKQTCCWNIFKKWQMCYGTIIRAVILFPSLWNVEICTIKVNTNHKKKETTLSERWSNIFDGPIATYYISVQ